MKVFLLCPSFYTLDKTIKLGFTRLGHTVIQLDYRKELEKWKGKVNTQIYRLPFKFRNKWETFHLSDINKIHLREYEKHNPDIVFIYNNEMLLPETIKYFRQKSKIIFFLGDNPYYTPTNNYFLNLLTYADLIISPDSFWKEQLELIGIKNIVLDFPGYNDEMYKNIIVTKEDKINYNYDILFVGRGYVDGWGYKRALFLNHFVKFNLKAYGDRHFVRWFKFFPELEEKFELKSVQITFEKLAIMSRCAKVYPVDANPALLNGVHLRVFDCIASGILPLTEYRKDMDIFFKNVHLPLIKNYNEIETMTKKLLSNDNIREKTLAELQEYLNKQYLPETVIARLISKI